jgi:hypothetical protein
MSVEPLRQPYMYMYTNRTNSMIAVVNWFSIGNWCNDWFILWFVFALKYLRCIALVQYILKFQSFWNGWDEVSTPNVTYRNFDIFFIIYFEKTKHGYDLTVRIPIWEQRQEKLTIAPPFNFHSFHIKYWKVFITFSQSMIWWISTILFRLFCKLNLPQPTFVFFGLKRLGTYKFEFFLRNPQKWKLIQKAGVDTSHEEWNTHNEIRFFSNLFQNIQKGLNLSLRIKSWSKCIQGI